LPWLNKPRPIRCPPSADTVGETQHLQGVCSCKLADKNFFEKKTGKFSEETGKPIVARFFRRNDAAEERSEYYDTQNPQ
jgi:hypothetical protein